MPQRQGIMIDGMLVCEATNPSSALVTDATGGPWYASSQLSGYGGTALASQVPVGESM